MSQFNYQTICSKVLSTLSQKQKEILERRFGLDGGQRETLQSIGEDFGVTRERVRQVEVEALANLAEQKGGQDLKGVFPYFEKRLKQDGGLRREDILLGNLGRNRFQNHVYFLLTLGEPFHRFSESEEFYPFWTIEEALFERMKKIVKNLSVKFENEKKPLLEKELLGSVKDESSQFFLASLEIAKQIEKGPLGEFGLVVWPEIKPRGVRDRAYLSLKKAGRPLHFREIATVSSTLGGEFLQQKQVLSQTVHNELIRDERFVLVGRGVYALKEWGYKPGTIKDVICQVLKEARRPLAEKEVMAEVLNQRMVKPNTVLLSLHDKNYFLKDSQSRYSLNPVVKI